jgi:glycine cleavage system H protein
MRPYRARSCAINEALNAAPELINQDAYAHWIWKLQPDENAEFAQLLNAQDYHKIASGH